MIGHFFNWRHAAGVTQYRVENRHHSSAGYYDCVAVRAIEGTHTFVGGIQTFSRSHILLAGLTAEPDLNQRKLEAGQ